MRFGFHAGTESEYAKAIRHYLKIDPKVAEDFVAEIEHGVQAICRNPLTWRVIEDDVRRYLIHRFPYGIYYTVDANFVTVWAIFHLNRKPGLWKGRLRKR
jgi:toxin ParE1/3/4